MTIPELQELTEEQCWQMLARKKVGRLAVSIENRPDIFPVNYQVDGETVVVRTAPGLKLAAAILGAGVAFEVDSLDEMNQTGWSVVCHGRAEEVERVEELMDAERLLIEPWSKGDSPKNRYLRIRVEEITGRQIPEMVSNTPTMSSEDGWE